jgi:glycosyltransferase involved in cell wall biosynthesis
MKAPVSILIPTRNEEANLAGCLASCAFADEIVVVDSGSGDGTRRIAEAHGVRLVDFAWDRSFPKKKNWALANLPWRHPWIFILDADERITPALADEIIAVVSTAPDPDAPVGYYVNRRFWFLDGWLLHCGYYPSWNLRLFRHSLGRYERLTDQTDTHSGDNEVHEHVDLRGRAARLRGEMEHYAFPDIATWVEKHNRYSNWEAAHQLGAHGTAGARIASGLASKRRLRRIAWRLPFRPTLRFLYHYVLRRGFLDGYRGLVFCRLMAFYEFLSVAKAREALRARHSKIHRDLPPPSAD